jgi:hypothetical protein
MEVDPPPTVVISRPSVRLSQANPAAVFSTGFPAYAKPD